MRQAVSSGIIMGATFGWLVVLFAGGPFERINAGLDRVFGGLPAWTQVEDMHRDASTQELSRGESPLESFRILKESWAEHPGAQRIVLMGNSQTQMTSLAPGERRPSGPEETYTDQMADYYQQTGWHKVFYRLSAGALSYQEMLWYAAYLASNAALKPEVLLVQLNYQNFANGEIRGGMLEMLSDASFRRAVQEVAHQNRPESPAFAEALYQYERGRRPAQTDAAPPGLTLGFWLETAFREKLDRIPAFGHRDGMRQSFVFMLIRGRTYLLRLNPAGRRSLSGWRIAASRAALEDLVALCERSGIQVILFQAPANPAVPLYGTSEDDRAYHEFCATVASRSGIVMLDFEHSVPAAEWGMELNVPDPLHLGRAGHRLLSQLMLSALEGER